MNYISFKALTVSYLEPYEILLQKILHETESIEKSVEKNSFVFDIYFSQVFS